MQLTDIDNDRMCYCVEEANNAANPVTITIEISGNIPKDKIIDRIIDELGKSKPSGVGYMRRKTDAVN